VHSNSLPRYFCDSQGRKFELEVYWNAPFLSMFAVSKNIRVAKALLHVSAPCAKLSDIIVSDKIVTSYAWWREVLKCPKSEKFRGQGIGTALLENVLAKLRTLGVSRVDGEMVTEDHQMAALARWYVRNGFVRRPGTNMIYCDL